MPTEKRARQKAARQKKRAALARKARFRKRLRSGGFVAAGAAAVILLVLATTGVFSGSSAPKSATGTPKSTTTTTTAQTAAQKDAIAQSSANKLAVAAGCPASTATRTNTLTWSSAPAMTITPAKTYSATVKTTAGTFVISLDAKTAPVTVNNFVFLADQGFYKCVIFHRVIPGFMDQTGDPTGTGSGGPGYEFANENVPTAYATGDVAMANSGANTNGSQFFIVATGGSSRLSPTYSLFGTVTSGMTVVEKINAEGNANTTANGVPPAVVQRMLSVTIQES